VEEEEICVCWCGEGGIASGVEADEVDAVVESAGANRRRDGYREFGIRDWGGDCEGAVRKDDVSFSGLERAGKGKLQIGKFCTALQSATV
jgi:hypothetical protein